MWYSEERKDNFVAPDGLGPPDSSYKKVFANGNVLTAPRRVVESRPEALTVASATLSLSIYLNNATGHTYTTATPAGRAWAVANGYSLWKDDVGYVCTRHDCSAPPTPPLSPSILLRQPGAILEECTTESAAAAAGWTGEIQLGETVHSGDTPTMLAKVDSGNLEAIVWSNGTVEFRRHSDGAGLMRADGSFGPGSEGGYWGMGLNVSTDGESRVHGLGELEGTSQGHGCPIDGKQV